MELEIYKTLVLSTGHLTAETLRHLERLSEGDERNNFIARDYGFLVICWSCWFEEGDEGSRKDFEQLPGDLQHVLASANALGVKAVEFDQDGNLYDQFPIYEHE